MDMSASGDAGLGVTYPNAKTIFGLPLPPSLSTWGQERSSQSSSPEKVNLPQRPASGIPRIKRQKFPQVKSVIYGSTSHNPNHKLRNNYASQSHQTLSQIKSPWVPAPGKSTTSTSINNTQSNGNGISKNLKMQGRLGSAPPDFTFYHNGPTSFQDDDVMSNLSSVSAVSYPIRRLKTRSRKSSKREKGGRQVKSTRESKKTQKVRSSHSSYTLTSKDSLVDVTTFLTTKREEIMRLWEHYLTDGEHPELLTTFENANRAAAEAANEVEHLRKSIHDLHEKETSLSEGDCELLDQLRQRVLTKIKEFEEVNNKVQNDVVAVTEIKPLDPDSHPIEFCAKPSKSSTSAIKNKPKDFTKQVDVDVDDDGIFFIKEKSLNFQHPTLSESSIDSFLDPGAKTKAFRPVQTLPKHSENVKMPINTRTTATQSRSNTTATTAPSTTVDLSKLTQMYNEQYQMPPVSSGQINFTKDSKNRNVQFQHDLYELKKGPEVEILQYQLGNLLRHLKINDETSHKSLPTHEDEEHFEHHEPEIYKKKVQQLQRKLNDAEAEMEELKDDLERVESESNFKVRLLKSSFEDRLDNLENYPEYLQITEMRLKDAIRSKTELEKVVKKQEQDISRLKAGKAELREEIEENKNQFKGLESSGEFFHMKIKELEQLNENLSREMTYKNQQIANLSQKLESNVPKTFPRTSFSNLQLHQNESPETSQALLRRNKRLEMKVDELRDRLAKAHKNVHILQITKEKMQSRLNQRQEELLTELEESRRRNRQLQNQLHYIRTTYHDLFPTELFHISEPHSNLGTQKSKLRKEFSTNNKEATNNTPRKSSKLSTTGSKSVKHAPVFETPISQTKSWVTGQPINKKEDELASDEFTDDDGIDDLGPRNGRTASKTLSDLDDPSES